MTIDRTTVRRTAQAAATLIALALLGGCVSIPQRAWRNGEAMSQSRAYSEVMSGSRSFRAHRELEDAMNPLRLGYGQERSYPAFPKYGTWW